MSIWLGEFPQGYCTTGWALHSTPLSWQFLNFISTLYARVPYTEYQYKDQARPKRVWPQPLTLTEHEQPPLLPTLVPSSFSYNLLLCAPEGDAERVQCSSTTHLPSWAASRISSFTYRYLYLTQWEHDVFSRIHDAPYRVFASKEKGTGFTSAWACCGKQEAIPGHWLTSSTN